MLIIAVGFRCVETTFPIRCNEAFQRGVRGRRKQPLSFSRGNAPQKAYLAICFISDMIIGIVFSARSLKSEAAVLGSLIGSALHPRARLLHGTGAGLRRVLPGCAGRGRGAVLPLAALPPPPRWGWVLPSGAAGAAWPSLASINFDVPRCFRGLLRWRRSGGVGGWDAAAWVVRCGAPSPGAPPSLPPPPGMRRPGPAGRRTQSLSPAAAARSAVC